MPSSSEASLDKVQEESKEAMEAAGNLADQTKDQFLAAADTKLQQLDQQFSEWSAKVETWTGQAKATAQDQLDALKAKREALQAKLDEVKAATQSAWADLKQGFSSSLDELENAFREAGQQFQDDPAKSGDSEGPSSTTS